MLRRAPAFGANGKGVELVMRREGATHCWQPVTGPHITGAASRLEVLGRQAIARLLTATMGVGRRQQRLGLFCALFLTVA